jgi:hypothetical protein
MQLVVTAKYYGNSVGRHGEVEGVVLACKLGYLQDEQGVCKYQIAILMTVQASPTQTPYPTFQPRF